MGRFVISVCILTKNSQSSLAATLQSLRQFDEIIVLDTGSTDQTIEIAQKFSNVKVESTSFTSFGPLRNQASNIAKHDWILAIDSDEVLSEKLQNEILSLSLQKDCVYEIDFHNYYNNKWIRGCGWHPEKHIRLYHRKTTRFSESSVHESVIASNLKVVRLKNPIHHTPYRSISDFLSKMQLYSELFAKEHHGKKSSSFAKAIIHALSAFLKSYILKYGILMGKEGAIISLYNANVAFYKYMKLKELNQRNP